MNNCNTLNQIDRGGFTTPATSIMTLIKSFLSEYNEKTGEVLQRKQCSNDAIERLMQYLIFSILLENLTKH